MKTNFKKIGDTVVVSMDGRLNYEIQEPLKEDLYKLVENTKKGDSVPQKIIFNLENLEFVGSSGISTFIQTLKELSNRASTKPRYCNVKSEFKRIIKALDDSGNFEFYENEEKARSSFDQ